MRFVPLQLRNDTWTDDAVSKPLLAALARPQGFENRPQSKACLLAILKIDSLRSSARLMVMPATSADDTDELDRLNFQADSQFVEAANDWRDAQESLQQVQFFRFWRRAWNACRPHIAGSSGCATGWSFRRCRFLAKSR